MYQYKADSFGVAESSFVKETAYISLLHNR